jgi:effector-binding domain-containing protein
MLHQPQIVRTQSQATVSVYLDVSRDEIRNVMGPARAEVSAALAEQGIASAGPFFSHHLKMPAARFELEVGRTVDRPIPPSGRVRAKTLPAATVARAIYEGPYEGLGEAWGEFSAWIAKAGHKPQAELWEVYVAGPESGSDPSKWRTELNRPLQD